MNNIFVKTSFIQMPMMYSTSFVYVPYPRNMVELYQTYPITFISDVKANRIYY